MTLRLLKTMCASIVLALTQSSFAFECPSIGEIHLLQVEGISTLVPGQYHRGHWAWHYDFIDGEFHSEWVSGYYSEGVYKPFIHRTVIMAGRPWHIGFSVLHLRTDTDREALQIAWNGILQAHSVIQNPQAQICIYPTNQKQFAILAVAE